MGVCSETCNFYKQYRLTNPIAAAIPFLIKHFRCAQVFLQEINWTNFAPRNQFILHKFSLRYLHGKKSQAKNVNRFLFLGIVQHRRFRGFK